MIQRIYLLILSLVITVFGQIKQIDNGQDEYSEEQSFIEYKVSDASFAEYVAETKMFFLFGNTIVGKNTSVTGRIRTGKTDWGKTSARIIISAKSFSTDNTSRDDHIREILNSNTHPDIIFNLNLLSKSISTDSSNDTYLAKGSLTVNGITKSISFPVIIFMEQDKLKISGEIEILYMDFGIEPPTVVGGVVKQAKKSILLKAYIVANKVKS